MAVTFHAYNKLVEYFGDNTIDLDTGGANDYGANLMSANFTQTTADTVWTDASADVLATANGFVPAVGAGTGTSIGVATWVESSGVVTFDSPDVQWTASGGDIGPATDLVVMNDISSGVTDALMFAIDFGGANTATDGGTFNIAWNGSGIFTIP